MDEAAGPSRSGELSARSLRDETPAVSPARSITRTHLPAGGADGDEAPGLDPERPQRIGPYEIVGELGRGGVGVVYEAYDPRLDRVVALKTLIAGRDASEAQIQRFLREVRACAHLRHPHLVAVHDAGKSDGRFYLAMERIDGVALDTLLEERGPLPPREAARLLLPVVRALEHAHREGFVHRDVKPENILVDGQGEAYLTDFGLALDLSEASRLTRSNQSVGTPAFMAPEQLRGRHDDPRVDIYALGATLYEVLTGRVPFAAESFADLVDRVLLEDPPPPRALRPSISRDLEAIVLKCLEKDPAARYPSAGALADDLERFLEGRAVEAGPPSWARRLARRLRRQRTLVAGALVALAGLGGGLFLALGVEAEVQAARQRSRRLEAERRRLLNAHREALAHFEREEAKRLAFVEATLAATPRQRLAALDRFLERYPDAWEGRVARAKTLRRLALERRADRNRGEDDQERGLLLRALTDLRIASEAAAHPEPLLLLQAEVLRADLRDAPAARRLYRELAGRADAPPPYAALTAYARARLACADGRWEEARAALERALESWPDLSPARLLEAELLLRAGRADEALERLDRLAGEIAVEAEACRLRGRCLLALGDAGSALRDALRAVELDPGDPRAHALLARVHLARGDATRALAAADRAVDLSPPSPEAFLLRARAVLAAWGDLPRALGDLERARRLGPLDPADLAAFREAALAQARAQGIVLDAAVRQLLGEAPARSLPEGR